MKTVRFIETPIGRLAVVASESAVTEILFCNRADAKQTGPDTPQARTPKSCGSLPDGTREGDSEILRQAVRELEEYFAGTRREFTFPIAAEGTPFQQCVWLALREIPYGQTRTYAQIAAAIGKPRACRAVGMANNRNPLPVVVPCHRVIGTSGKLTGYAGGLDVKERLLEVEGNTLL